MPGGWGGGYGPNEEEPHPTPLPPPGQPIGTLGVKYHESLMLGGCGILFSIHPVLAPLLIPSRSTCEPS